MWILPESYSKLFAMTSQTHRLSVSWGYAVQVFEGNQLLPDLISLQRTFMPWKRSRNVNSSHFMFNMREFPRDPCKRPIIFFLESVFIDTNVIWSNYSRRATVGNCLQKSASQNLKQIKVFSHKLEFDLGQLQAPRRHCCDVFRSSEEVMEIGIRQCLDDEIIAMHL
uniref:Uncharacterized protein n=1 Tax=Nelumbo nucifera TaxID=4432 RepID=A0A822XTA6_NELNU|nr:TPA_asm: hypothetical protein HUJ06_024715 [Nelumbo nucifera]